MFSIKDVIIGAPYEKNNDDSIGALYIYFGSEKGLNKDKKVLSL